MVCPSNDEDTLHRLVIVAVTVSALPLVAFLYALVVWFTYTLYGEISWKHPVYLRSVALRWLVVVVSWASSVGVVTMCGSCGEGSISGRSRGCLIGASLVLAVFFAAFGAKLVMRTRKEEVVGIETVPFYGSSFLEGKFMVVTGANNGIGFEATRQLAAQGATVAMLCRNPNRAKKAIENIVKRQAELHAKNPVKYPTATISNDKLIFVPVDLTDFESIRKATDTIEDILLSRRKTLPNDQPCYVDALVCNAGLMMDKQSTTKDGLETMMQANHLGHFLLMKTMFNKHMLKDDGNDTTRSNEPSRVCILTSTTYKFTASTTGFDFVDPYCSKGHRQYTLFGQYSMSKLANLLHSRDLARRYNDISAKQSTESALAVFAVHPGIVRTNVVSNMAWYHRLGDSMFAWIITALSKTPEEGAYSVVYTVAAPLDQIPFWKMGSYVVNCKQHPTDPYVDAPNGKVDAMRLWEWSDEQISEGAAAININGTKGDGEKKEQ